MKNVMSVHNCKFGSFLQLIQYIFIYFLLRLWNNACTVIQFVFYWRGSQTSFMTFIINPGRTKVPGKTGRLSNPHALTLGGENVDGNKKIRLEKQHSQLEWRFCQQNFSFFSYHLQWCWSEMTLSFARNPESPRCQTMRSTEPSLLCLCQPYRRRRAQTQK